MHTEKEFISAIEQHQKIIHKVCHLYMPLEQDRDDLFQEILMAAWKGWKNFKAEARFSTWLYRVALNTAITFYRKGKRRVKTTALEEGLPGSLTTGSSLHHEKLTTMHLCINELSKIDKALVMLYMEDYSYAEIADMMGITPNHVAVKMNRIKGKLKESSKKYI